jgi:hypothetical protein
MVYYAETQGLTSHEGTIATPEDFTTYIRSSLYYNKAKWWGFIPES